MCTGIGIALIASASAAVVGTAGSLYAGAETRKAAEYSAKVGEQAAETARMKAAYDEELHRERVRKTLSTMRALYGKSGVDITGSPLLELSESAGQGELDALAIRYGGDVEAARQRSSATLTRMQGKAAQTASYFQAGSTLLSGAGSAYTNQQILKSKGTV